MQSVTNTLLHNAAVKGNIKTVFVFTAQWNSMQHLLTRLSETPKITGQDRQSRKGILCCKRWFWMQVGTASGSCTATTEVCLSLIILQDHTVEYKPWMGKLTAHGVDNKVFNEHIQMEESIHSQQANTQKTTSDNVRWAVHSKVDPIKHDSQRPWKREWSQRTNNQIKTYISRNVVHVQRNTNSKRR